MWRFEKYVGGAINRTIAKVLAEGLDIINIESAVLLLLNFDIANVVWMCLY